MNVCHICSGLIAEEDGLKCSSCHKKCHVRCGTGLSNLSPLTITTHLNECAFLCPLCNIGQKNNLINSVITINQVYNERKHATEFNLGHAFHTLNTDDDVTNGVQHGEAHEETNVVAPVNTIDVPTSPSGSQANGENTGERIQNNSLPVGHGDKSQQLPPSLVDESLTPLHEHDVSRAKKLTYILGTFLRLPGHPNTVLIGDSHFSHMDGKEIDPDDDQVRVRSVGGLCIPATVYAISQHKFVHKKIKTVVWNLGTNDALHSQQHCDEDRVKYLGLLYKESVRIFPKATINFIIPFSGMKGVSKPFLDELEKDLKLACPNMVRLRPPSMRNKISKSGVHLNNSGRDTFVRFLRSKFVVRKQRIFSSDSGRKAEYTTTSPDNRPSYAEAHVATSTGLVHHAAPSRSDPRPEPSSVPSNVPQSTIQHGHGFVNDIAAKVMELITQQNMLYRYYPPLSQWPR